MVKRVLFLSLATLLAGPAARTAKGETFVMPEGDFVLDGGDLERARLDAGTCLDPSVADRHGTALPAGSTLMARAASLATGAGGEGQPVAARPMAFEYSDGYRIRLKIHRYASYATLPLFVSQYVVGQKLYGGNASDGTRSLHGALAATTGVLFGVNTVTGVWNLHEGWKDPNHRTKRMIHGILMLAADAGFVATGMLAPDDEGEGGGSRATHRTVALASMGVATVAYLMMLIGN